jgi:hypothetical protein
MPEKPLTAKEQFAEIRLMLKTLAVTTVQHDDQIEGLIRAAGKHDAAIAALTKQVAETNKAVASLEKQFQAYINTLPRQ